MAIVRGVVVPTLEQTRPIARCLEGLVSLWAQKTCPIIVIGAEQKKNNRKQKNLNGEQSREVRTLLRP